MLVNIFSKKFPQICNSSKVLAAVVPSLSRGTTASPLVQRASNSRDSQLDQVHSIVACAYLQF